LTLRGPIEEFTVVAPAVPPEGIEGRFSVILLCVKAQDTEEATRALEPHLDPAGCVVSVQNGLNEPIIGGIVGAERVIGCFVNFGADYLEPGVVQFSGRGTVVVGELKGDMTSRIRLIHNVLTGFDTNAVITDNISGYLWSKLAYGAMLFATALGNESIADSLADIAHRDLYVRLGREVLGVAVANEILPESFDGFDPHAFVPTASSILSEQSLDDMVAFNRRSAKTHSGIWRDLAVRKRRTEVDAQLGPIVEAGKLVDVPTPITSRLIELIHEIEDGDRAQSAENLNVLEGAAI
jgi:2-dehydropantoate 2-reductase